MVALYQYREAERIEAPAVVGVSVLLQARSDAVPTTAAACCSQPCLPWRLLVVCRRALLLKAPPPAATFARLNY